MVKNIKDIFLVAILLVISTACVSSPSSEVTQPDSSDSGQSSGQEITDTVQSMDSDPFTLFPCIPSDHSIETARVTQIIDGDTIDVILNGESERVRYIGVDTPERNDTGYSEATQYNASLVEEQEVRMIKDVSDTDDYGRLLRYVYIGTTFVNYELARNGYAETIYYPPDISCANTFSEAVHDAQEDEIGLWVNIPDPASLPISSQEPSVVISELLYDGHGDDEPDEYVEITNQSSEQINLKGWTLSDNSRIVYVFPGNVLESGQVCRIYTNEDHSEWCGFNTQTTNYAIWNNSGDCAILKDKDSTIIDTYCY